MIRLFIKESFDPDVIESKWANIESKQTPDSDQINIEQYQVSKITIFLIVYTI